MAQGRISKRDNRKGMRPDRTLALTMPAASTVNRAAWFATMVALLLAFTWQSFIVQTHRHYDFSAATSASLAVQQPGKSSPADLPASCPICSELAHVGQAVLPTPVTIAAPAPAPVWLTTTAPLALSRSERSHAWQSRAPPTHLQA